MKQLLQRVPDRGADAHTKIISIYQKFYNAVSGAKRKSAATALMDATIEFAKYYEGRGEIAQAVSQYRKALIIASRSKSPRKDMMTREVERLQLKQRAEARIGMLRKKLTANPKDKQSADELIRLLIVEMNNPAEAQEYAFLFEGKTKRLERR